MSPSRTCVKHELVFKVTRHGAPIEHTHIRGAKDPGIAYSMEFAEYEACVAAGPNLNDWVQGKYPRGLKAKVIAWYELHNEVDMHSSYQHHLRRQPASARSQTPPLVPVGFFRLCA